MRKHLTIIVATLFAILTIIYLIINSSYIFDIVAKEYAPKFGFSYSKIEGNPISGIKLIDLRYKNHHLADRIRLHINPYKILEGNIALSRLDLKGVSLETLQTLIKDFSKQDNIEDRQNYDNSNSLPFGIELNNIHLSLKPFSIMGIYIYKENLNVEYIRYSGNKFTVGKLSQEAISSLGDVILEGSFRDRVLDLDKFRIYDLKLEKLLSLIDEISKTNQGDSKQSNSTIFIPKQIKSKELIFTMNPYEIYGQEISSIVLNGKDINLDIKNMLINRAKLKVDFKSTIGNIDANLECKDDSCVISNITLDRLKAKSIISLLDRNSTDSNSSHIVVADLPFVPDTIDIQNGNIELVPEKIAKVNYFNTSVKLSNLFIDLRQERVTLNSLLLNLETDIARVRLNTSIDRDVINIQKLNITKLNLKKVLALNNKKVKTKSDSSKKTKLKYIPSTLNIDSIFLSMLPYKSRDISLKSSKIQLKDSTLNLSSMKFGNGVLLADIDSNLAQLKLLATLKGQRLTLNSNATSIILKQNLIKRYKLPIYAKAIKPIKIGGVVDRDLINLNIRAKGSQIYSKKRSNFNINTDIKSTLKYSISKRLLKSIIDSDINITPFAKAKLHTAIEYNPKSKLKYDALLKIVNISKVPKELKPLLRDLKIKAVGSSKRFNATLSSKALKGNISSKDMKRVYIQLNTKNRLKLSKYFKMPKKLKKSWAKLQLSSKIDTKKPLPIKVDFKVVSNLLNLKGILRYKNTPNIDATITLPKYSLLSKYDKNLNLKNLTPAKISVKPIKDKLHITLKSKLLKIAGDYNQKSKEIDTKIDIANSIISLKGKIDGNLKAKLSSHSVKKLFANLSKVYKFDAPKINGDLDILVTFKKDKTLLANISSKKFIPDSNSRIKNPINNLKISIKGNLVKKSFTINRYSLNIVGMKFFSNKASTIKIDKNSLIKLDNFWINDSLNIKGSYNTKRENGRFKFRAEKFGINHKNIKMAIATNGVIAIKKGKISVDGKVYILGGRVYYNLNSRHYASDNDIIILQHRKKKKGSFFEKNVKLSILIESKKPLLFKQRDLKVKLRPSMSIIKEYNSPLMVLGSIDLDRGGYYKFEGKKFVLDKSAIYFTGKATQPLLNIRLEYRRYGKIIWITVTGTGTEPVLNFSSSPYMTRDQILSFILFDTETSSNTSEEMLSMVGGGLAKSILRNMGLKLDTLVLRQNGFEVGKRISNKVSIIYDQKDESKIIVRIEHSLKVETDISVGQDSQSVDIIYKREY